MVEPLYCSQQHCLQQSKISSTITYSDSGSRNVFVLFPTGSWSLECQGHRRSPVKTMNRIFFLLTATSRIHMSSWKLEGGGLFLGLRQLLSRIVARGLITHSWLIQTHAWSVSLLGALPSNLHRRKLMLLGPAVKALLHLTLTFPSHHNYL